MKRYCWFALVCLACFVSEYAAPGAGSKALAEDKFQVFLLMSKDVFEDLLQEKVQATVPIQECVDGIPVSGSGSGERQITVQLLDSYDHADFIVTVNGTASASVRADVGPAIAFGSSRARFTTSKRIRFDEAHDYARD